MPGLFPSILLRHVVQPQRQVTVLDAQQSAQATWVNYGGQKMCLISGVGGSTGRLDANQSVQTATVTGPDLPNEQGIRFVVVKGTTKIPAGRILFSLSVDGHGDDWISDFVRHRTETVGF